MLKANCFLFSQNKGLDHKTWSGLWRALFVLQMFAHHFNFIQGRVAVPQLNSKQASPRTALALACAAVCHTLTLVANHHMTFKATPTGDMWTAIISKGGQYDFNENVWGVMTRRYLEPITALSNEQFTLIVDETQLYVKGGKATSSLDSGDEKDKEFEDLFAFR
ncbi:hypothetical protein PAXRUDRAFT_130571 [Paxillus rubicundulus Ve08.2h10]|uniref:Uncharacterized protein n=1 Tax=Paxillus rubicundulus Ve08.2h10 TaxID=930991 RepID=A0A0D0E5S4_9AGAM|nr:hypothetical protein PAXRUDRAFT_130571 [Paxillus rubicundulus Ve08.2h10]